MIEEASHFPLSEAWKRSRCTQAFVSALYNSRLFSLRDFHLAVELLAWVIAFSTFAIAYTDGNDLFEAV